MHNSEQFTYGDAVALEELEVYARIGCSLEERAFPQRLTISVKLMLGKWQSGSEEGDLSTTVCYAKAAELIRSIGAKKPWVLLEELALAEISALFREFAAANLIQLTINKFVVPGAKAVSVHLEREREEIS